MPGTKQVLCQQRPVVSGVIRRVIIVLWGYHQLTRVISIIRGPIVLWGDLPNSSQTIPPPSINMRWKSIQKRFRIQYTPGIRITYWEKFCTENGKLKLVLAISVNCRIPVIILTRIARYPCQITCRY